jgi:hypothetical protein
MPAVRMTRSGPNRVASRRPSREPARPPTQGTPNARPYCHGLNPSWPSMRTATSGEVAMISPVTRTVLRNRGRSDGWPRMYRHPSVRPLARSRDCLGRDCLGRTGRSSWPPIERMPAAEIAKLMPLATMVVTGPNSPIAAPPSGGPSAVAVQVVDSNRPFAVSRSPGGTSSFRQAPPAAVKMRSARPDTAAGPACSTRIATRENASNASHVPNVLTACAAQSQPNCRPSRLPAMSRAPAAVSPCQPRAGPPESNRRARLPGKQSPGQRLSIDGQAFLPHARALL